jgi:hypothetical protein
MAGEDTGQGKRDCFVPANDVTEGLYVSTEEIATSPLSILGNEDDLRKAIRNDVTPDVFVSAKHGR